MDKMYYKLFAGHVTSSGDLERHYVSERQLMGLFKVSRSDCVNFMTPRQLADLGSINIVELRPQYDGNYGLPN